MTVRGRLANPELYRLIVNHQHSWMQRGHLFLFSTDIITARYVDEDQEKLNQIYKRLLTWRSGKPVNMQLWQVHEGCCTIWLQTDDDATAVEIKLTFC